MLGVGHPDYLKSVGMLAALLVEQAHHAKPGSTVRKRKLAEAEPLYAEAVGGFSGLCGKYHPTTNSYVNERARVLLDMGRSDEAESEMKDLLSGAGDQREMGIVMGVDWPSLWSVIGHSGGC